MLFRVKDARIHILGSVHVLPPNTIIPAHLINIAAAADRIVIEHHERLPTVPLVLQDGRQLSDGLDSDQYKKIRAIWQELNVRLPLESMPLWRVGIVAAFALIPRMGLSPADGVDKQILKAARTAPRTLETLDSVLELFWEVPRDELVRNLKFFTLKEIRDRIQSLVDAWQLNDFKLLEGEAAIMRKRAPEYFDKIVLTRNHSWIPKIISHIRSGEQTLIVVGCLHLVGNDSVIDLLGKTGIEVTRVD